MDRKHHFSSSRGPGCKMDGSEEDGGGGSGGGGNTQQKREGDGEGREGGARVFGRGG